MEVTVPLFAGQLAKGYGMRDIAEAYRSKYAGPVVAFKEETDKGGFLSAGAMSGKDGMWIAVYGNEERILLTAVYDNLGKGASGAALECLNMAMGLDKAYGLDI
jgi:N-acetyl-gamma-glutamyl-phosphate reductase